MNQKTDLICCYAFAAVNSVFLLISLYSLIQGDEKSIALPYDPDHRSCGNDLIDFPYIYFTTPQQNFFYRTTCVKECPKAGQQLECAINSVVKSCLEHPSAQDLSQSVLIYNTIAYKGSICLPVTEYYFRALYTFMKPEAYQAAAKDTFNGQIQTLAFGLMCTVMCIVIILFLERNIKLFIRCFVLLSILATLFGAVICYMNYFLASHPPQLPKNPLEQVNEQVLLKSVDSEVTNPSTYLVLTIVLFLFAIVIVIIAIVEKHQIDRMILYIKIGGDFIKSNQNIIFVSISVAIINICYTYIVIEILVNLISTFKINQQEHQLPFDQVIADPFTIIVLLFGIFTFIWTEAVFMGFNEFIISSAVVKWQNEQGNCKSDTVQPIRDSLLSVPNHFGTIVFGSIVQLCFPTLLLNVLYKYGILKEFYEKYQLKFSSYNYVLTSLNATHFLDSGVEVRKLLIEDHLGGKGDSFINIGRIFAAGFFTSGSYYLFSDMPYAYVPSLIVWVINIQYKILTYSISSTFMSLYGTSSEAIYILYQYNSKNHPEDYQCTVTLQLYLRDEPII